MIGIGFSRPDNHVRDFFAGTEVLELDLGTDEDPIGGRVMIVDHSSIAEHQFQLEDPPLYERLLVLRILIFGVLGEIAELFGELDPLRNFLSLDLLEVLQLILELFEPLAGQYRFFFSFRCHPSPSHEKK